MPDISPVVVVIPRLATLPFSSNLKATLGRYPLPTTSSVLAEFQQPFSTLTVGAATATAGAPKRAALIPIVMNEERPTGGRLTGDRLVLRRQGSREARDRPRYSDNPIRAKA